MADRYAFVGNAFLLILFGMVTESVWNRGNSMVRGLVCGYPVILVVLQISHAFLNIEPSSVRVPFARFAEEIREADDRYERSNAPQRVTIPIYPGPWGEINLNIPDLVAFHDLPPGIRFPARVVDEGRDRNSIWSPELGELENIGEGLHHSKWLGDLNMLHWPWIYHRSLGWLRVRKGSRPHDLWLYDPNLDWLWTSKTQFPYSRSATRNDWLRYRPGSRRPRWFYIHNSASPEAEGWGIR